MIQLVDMVKQDIKRLYKSDDDKQLSGVLGGIAEYMSTDPTIIRVLYIFLTFVTGIVPGLLAYFVLAIIIPKKSEVIK